jgi:hypothetical protein
VRSCSSVHTASRRSRVGVTAALSSEAPPSDAADSLGGGSAACSVREEDEERADGGE